MKATLIGTLGVVVALAAIFAGVIFNDAMAAEPRVGMTAGIAESQHVPATLGTGCSVPGDQCPVLAGNGNGKGRGKGKGGSGSYGNGPRDGSGNQNRRGQGGGGNGTGTCRQ
jgi:hypothetical protein